MNRTAPKNGKSKTRKFLKRACAITGFAITAFVAVSLLIVVVQLFSGKEPNLFGYRFYYILTDSMSPTYDAGDVVLSKTLPSEQAKLEIKVGDVVTFIGNSGSQIGKTITHRVVTAPYFDETEGEYFLITKGDKEGAAADAPIPLKNVEARLVGESRVAGFLFRAIRTPAGYVLFIVVPVLAVIAILVLKIIMEYRLRKTKLREETEKKRVETLKAQAVAEYLRTRNESAPPPPTLPNGTEPNESNETDSPAPNTTDSPAPNTTDSPAPNTTDSPAPNESTAADGSPAPNTTENPTEI